MGRQFVRLEVLLSASVLDSRASGTILLRTWRSAAVYLYPRTSIRYECTHQLLQGLFMRRVSFLVGLIAFVGGCAGETRIVTKTVKIETVQTCRVTTRPMKQSTFCRHVKYCHQLSCAEAYFRYTACRQTERDGGTAGRKNGVPCQAACGKDALQMADRIRQNPFELPMVTTRTCTQS